LWSAKRYDRGYIPKKKRVAHASVRTRAWVYGWFTEGFDTLDLKEAKALLEELAL
jgi:hypothetical protein